MECQVDWLCRLQHQQAGRQGRAGRRAGKQAGRKKQMKQGINKQ
jgi:hypothetical protein